MSVIVNRMALVFLVLGVFFTMTAKADEFDVAGKYAQSCAVCHKSGVAGAPRKGDEKAWAKRFEKGNDKVLENVKNGIGAMPAMGMCQDCTDEQFQALIQYMVK